MSLISLCAFVCSGISCMAQDCSLQMPEDFVLPLLPAEELKDKYRRYLFRDYVEVCVCVSVWDLFGQRVSRICRYGHWDSRGMWERCESAGVFLSMSESLSLLCTFRPPASFPLWYSWHVMWHRGGSKVIAPLFMFKSSVLFPCASVSCCHHVVAILFANNPNRAHLILWLKSAVSESFSQVFTLWTLDADDDGFVVFAKSQCVLPFRVTSSCSYVQVQTALS